METNKLLTAFDLLRLLQSVDEEQLKRAPVLIGAPIEDNVDKEHEYGCSHATMRPGLQIVIHTSNMRAPQGYWPFEFKKSEPESAAPAD
jgi:hypothetical protein